jgi:hypothetical protein
MCYNGYVTATCDIKRKIIMLRIRSPVLKPRALRGLLYQKTLSLYNMIFQSHENLISEVKLVGIV